MRNVLLLILSSLLTSGCAALTQAINADPTKIQNIRSNEKRGDVMGTVSLAAERRTVLVSLNKENKGRFCAEPPPEVANQITAKSIGDLKVDVAGQGNAAANLQDTFDSTVIALSERTVLLDIYRTATYSLCQYHLNGAFSDGELAKQFSEITHKALDSLANNEQTEK